MLRLGYAHGAEVCVEFLGDARFVEEVLAVEYDDVGGFAAVLLLHQDVAMTEAAVGLWTHEERSFLLLDSLLVQFEVVRLEDVVAAVVDRNLK